MKGRRVEWKERSEKVGQRIGRKGREEKVKGRNVKEWMDGEKNETEM